MSFGRSNDPFKNLTKGSKSLGLTDSPGTSYQNMGTTLKPNKPIEFFLIYTVTTIILLIHSIVGLVTSIYLFAISFQKQNADRNSLIISFVVSSIFHIFRILVFFSSVPLGCIAKVPIFIIESLFVIICLIIDVIMLGVIIIDLAIKEVDFTKFADSDPSMQKYASYIALDVVFLAICGLYILALVRYSKVKNLYKRNMLVTAV